MALVGYIVILLLRLLNFDNNTNKTGTDIDPDVNVTFAESNIKIMINIFDQTTGFPLPYDDHMKKYLRIEAQEVLFDFINFKFGP